MKTAAALSLLLFFSPALSRAGDAAAVLTGDFYGSGTEPVSPGDLPTPSPETVSLAAAAAVPAVIAVDGLAFGEIGTGPLEFKNIKRLIAIFFPKKQVDEAALEKEFYASYGEYFADGVETEISGETMTIPPPDNYMALRVMEIPGYEKKMILIPFEWSRDPEDTNKVIPVFMERLRKVWREHGGRRPIIVLAHSWGSVLMLNAMHRLAESDPLIKIDKFITVGSPLVPGDIFIKAFMAVEISKEDLEKKVSYPKNLKYWENVWASRDMYSNSIAQADLNVQADLSVGKPEPVLLDLLLHNADLRPLAKKDLLTLRNVIKWHFAYTYDYKAYLRSISREVNVEIFSPLLSPAICSGRE